MAVPYPDIDPYDVLGLDNKANPLEIKKAYKKLSLQFHPDKLQQQQQDQQGEEVKDVFPKIQFAYSILSDQNKRTRYDTTGSLGGGGVDDDEDFFDWKQYFDSLTEKITVEMIDEDKIKYQNSPEEEEDIIQNFKYYEGDFLKLFEVIPHLEFDEQQESRIFDIIESLINNSPDDFEKSTIKSFEKYKKSRKTKVKNMLKKLAKEAKEAEQLEKMITEKHKTNDLKSIIQQRQNNRLDTLINSLESKYSDKKGKKRNTKEINDDDFTKIQQDLLNKKKKKKV